MKGTLSMLKLIDYINIYQGKGGQDVVYYSIDYSPKHCDIRSINIANCPISATTIKVPWFFERHFIYA
jgi:hypothetical protein